MKELKFKSIKVSHCLATDREFNFFEEENSAKLEKLGKYNYKPILVIPLQRFYKILSGFEIYNLYKEKNIKNIPAFILNEKTDFKNIILTIINYNLLKRGMNPIEICRLVHIVLEKGYSKRYFIKNFAGEIKIPAKIGIIEDYLKLQNLEQPIIEYLLNKNAPFKYWVIFNRIGKHSQKFFVELILKVKPSLSLFYEIANNLIEISIRDNKDINVLVKENDLKKILSQKSFGCLNEIRKIVFQKRYPAIWKYRKKLLKTLENIKFPHQMKVTIDKTMELRLIRLTADINSKKDIEQISKFFKDNNYKEILEFLD